MDKNLFKKKVASIRKSLSEILGGNQDWLIAFDRVVDEAISFRNANVTQFPPTFLNFYHTLCDWSPFYNSALRVEIYNLWVEFLNLQIDCIV